MTDRKQSYIHDRALDAEYAESARRPDPAPSIKDPVKRAWCMTQWTSLSCQADQLNLPDVYFDPDTRLLDKTTNRGLWKLVTRLYNVLGPDKAPLAYAVMKDAGAIEWRNYSDGCRGAVAEVVDQ